MQNTKEKKSTQGQDDEKKVIIFNNIFENYK